MKKILLVSLWITLVLSGCSWQEQVEKESVKTQQTKQTCKSFFTISSNNSQNYTLQAKVVSSNTKNIISNSAWIVKYLHCNAWQEVTKKTLIAKISPDWADPNIKNLINQKNSLQSQNLNTKNIISSTKNNFASQLNSLNIQKANLEQQIKNLAENLQKLGNQKKYWIWDLKTQLSSLQTQLKDLENSKEKLEQSKQDELSKLNKNIGNTISQADSLTKNIFLKIDEIYGITDENKHKNDAFETYLSAKDTSAKENIKTKFRQLTNQKVENWSEYLKKLDDLVNLVKTSIKSSVTSRTLSQTMIDSWYGLFSQYDTNLINTKNALDTLVENLSTIKNNYDNQILSLQTQINTVKNNIENIKSNKLGSYTSSIDIQINQTKSQLDNTRSSLSNIISQITSLKEQEKIQVKQLENQLYQLQSSLNSININLSPQNIYAQVSGKVKVKKVSVNNKVWPNSLLCQIIPDKASLKLQVYTNINWKLESVLFTDDTWKKCKLKVISKLPYKDVLTQNNIYETESIKDCSVKEWEVLQVQSKESIVSKNSGSKIYIPLEFVINEMDGQYVKKFEGEIWWKIQMNQMKKSKFLPIVCDWKQDCLWYIKVKLGNIDGTKVEVLSGLKIGDKVCK